MKPCPASSKPLPDAVRPTPRVPNRRALREPQPALKGTHR